MRHLGLWSGRGNPGGTASCGLMDIVRGGCGLQYRWLPIVGTCRLEGWATLGGRCSTGAGDKVLMGNSGRFEEADDIVYNGPCTPLPETGAFLKVLVHVTATEVVKGEL